MKIIFCIIISFLFLPSPLLNAQITSATQWTWLKGDNTKDQPGAYGTPGTANAANKPGGRESRSQWTDAAGNFWLFGGYGNAGGAQGRLNDLWKYNVSTGEWTWVKGDNIINQLSVYGTRGTPDAANKPGGRYESAAWTDASGNFWLLGGNGYDAASQDLLNDLWKYTTSTNEWTWVNGDNTIDQPGVYGTKGTPGFDNRPGARFASATWTDAAGNLWLFGGRNPQYLNDLWKYNVTTNQWTWVNGDNITNQQGIYGTKGTADPANKPGAREAGISWRDALGNFWLFGGFGFAAGNTLGYLNDLWKYDPGTNEWTWVSGDNTINQQGIYGTQGTPAATNKPGARYRSITWSDASGLWLFGGSGLAAIGDGLLNDLWNYNPVTNQWTWVKGDNTIAQPGIYGAPGTADPSNKPGARQSGLSWADAAGNFFLFGGFGVDAASSPGELNDLWQLGNNTVVPVTILNISAQVIQKNVQIHWQTAQEINTANFIIERSIDGINFTERGSVISAGNSSLTRNYLFTDGQSLAGISFYRVKMVDKDGRFTYSSLVKVNSQGVKNILSVFPNPVVSFATINLTTDAGAALNFNLYDFKGSHVINMRTLLFAGTNSFNVDMSTLSKGVYKAILTWGSETRNLKILKK